MFISNLDILFSEVPDKITVTIRLLVAFLLSPVIYRSFFIYTVA